MDRNYKILSEAVKYRRAKYLKGMEQMKARAFEPLELNYERYDEVETYVKSNLTSEQKQRLENLFKVIEGFETPLSLEILSSTHSIINEKPELTEIEVFERIQDWNERKKNLIKPEHISIAVDHLPEYGSKLHFG
ncbi:hypothetical protein [Segetibacter koreensis]|uniref:hypothetical protein n=1 Tax=Segetibacter koreensis TaxID=398037 RepID=UPI00036C98F5|nr:hypothetical protein [Segetibacter koreensis]